LSSVEKVGKAFGIEQLNWVLLHPLRAKDRHYYEMIAQQNRVIRHRMMFVLPPLIDLGTLKLAQCETGQASFGVKISQIVVAMQHLTLSAMEP